MHEMLIPIDEPNESEFADDLHVLGVWKAVHELLSMRSATFVVGRKPTEWFGVTVDASRVISFLEAEIRRHDAGAAFVHPLERYSELALRLHIQPSGGAQSAAGFPADRFLEQIFLACNLAMPGSCAFTKGDPAIRLDPALIDGAFHLGRPASDESLEADFWPELSPVTFEQAWNWLQEDLSYENEMATTPSQVAIFTLILLATRNPEDSDNILALTRAIEAIFGDGGHEKIGRNLEERIQSRFGASANFPRWFKKFYNLRSRLAHGEKHFPRPGLRSFSSPAAIAFLEEYHGPVAHGTRLVLASLYEMIRLNRRDLDA